jgi:preprotein translocase subunit SecF
MPASTARAFLRRLYRGETNMDFIGQRKRWYLASAVIILICLASIVFRGFNFGIEFAGGNQYLVPKKAGTTLEQMRGAVEGAGVTVSSSQIAGTGSSQTYVIRTERLDNQQQDNAQVAKVTTALARAGHVSEKEINNQEVSSSWGSEVTRQAIIALLVFLVAVSIFMGIRFRDLKASGAAVLALFHDLILTAGVYALVHFEVTPGTVVGLLTILGYSLYDTVVVFDKVDENTRGILGTTRYSYAEAANMAVNQTLMRSINTSLIGLLPVAGLLFIGAGILGVGTLEDLALVLFVGMLTGAYSSLFLATPWLVDFKLLDVRYKNHALRVANKRAADANRAAGAAGKAAGAAGKSSGQTARQKASAAVDDEETEEAEESVQSRIDALAGTAPQVGAKPSGNRPGTKRTPSRSGRPSGSRRRH